MDGVKETVGCEEERFDILGFGGGMECAVVRAEAVGYINSINIGGVDAGTGRAWY